MVSKWLERKIDDVILGLLPIPYADKEVVEVAEGFLGVDIPGLPHIDLGGMSTGHKILLVVFGAIPLLDAEYLDLVGLNPFKADEAGYHADDTELDLGDGATYNPSNPRQSGSNGGFPIGKYALAGGKILGVLVIIALGLFAVTGVVGGSGYGDLVANELGFQAAAINAPNIGATVAQAGKTVECLGNAACVRQWQFNNTQRPGSEEVGQDYSLKIESFNVNDGFPLDIANRRADDRVPVDFSVYNPRHGLKGIDARNVAYRVGIYDNAGSFTGNADCKTGWMPLGGEYADTDLTENGTILPGGFATPLGTHSELTLRNCKLLQPALGLRRRVKLQVAYDYSSQSTLQVQAMSREHMRSLEQRPRFKKSQTADTPVKTYVNVESPITYRLNEGGAAESSIFGLRVGFETGQRGLKYKVNTSDFELYDSGKTVDVDSTDIGSAVSCEDLQQVEGEEDQYTFSQDMSQRIDRTQSGSWFSSDSGPSPGRCAMVLEEEDIGSISPTGETLTFRIDANYTVMLEKTVDAFKAQNSRCTQYECPMLVPHSHSGVQNGNLISKCDSSIRIDANNGCGARLGEEWPKVDSDYGINSSVDSKIEEGETAYKLSNLKSILADKSRSRGGIMGTEEDDRLDAYASNLDETIVGADRQVVEQESSKAIVAGNNQGARDIEVRNVKFDVCQVNRTAISEARQYRDQNNPGQSVYFNVGVVNCQDRIKEIVGEQILNRAECAKEIGIQTAIPALAAYNELVGNGVIPPECSSNNIARLLSPCSGVKIMTNEKEIRCVQP